MTLKCNNCKREISDDPQEDLERGLIDTFVKEVHHPEDSIAISESFYYCDPACFVAHHGPQGGSDDA